MLPDLRGEKKPFREFSRFGNKREYYFKYTIRQKLFGNFTFLAILSNTVPFDTRKSPDLLVEKIPFREFSRFGNKREYYFKYTIRQKLLGNFTFLAILSNTDPFNTRKSQCGSLSNASRFAEKKILLGSSRDLSIFPSGMSKM